MPSENEKRYRAKAAGKKQQNKKIKKGNSLKKSPEDQTQQPQKKPSRPNKQIRTRSHTEIHRRSGKKYRRYRGIKNQEANEKQERFGKTLVRAKKILDNLGVKFHLSSGTCLGYYRTGKFLNHDPDIDLGIMIQDYSDQIIPSMKEGGFRLSATYGHKNNGLEYAWLDKKTGVKLDFIFYYPAEENVDSESGKPKYLWSACYKPPYQGLKDQVRYKHSYFEPLEQKFLGRTVRVPPVTYIEEYYGRWRVPQIGSYRYWKTRNTCSPKELDTFKGYLVDRNWQQTVTVAIKTFMRPETLERCLASLRKFYPEISVIVADDSTEEIKKTNQTIVQKYQGKYLDLPFDVGLSKGRNEMVWTCQTKYYLTIDDDSLFLAKTDLYKLYRFLEKRLGYQAIGGHCAGRPSFNCQFSHFGKEGNKKILYYWHRDRGPVRGGGVQGVRTDRMQNFFLARTVSLLALGGWDEELKLAEHNNFFVRAWQAKWKLAYTDEVELGEKRTQNAIYQIYRNRRDDFIKLSYQKTGKTIKLDDYMQYHPKLKRKTISKKVTVLRKTEKERRRLLKKTREK